MHIQVPQSYLDLINEVFEIEKKTTLLKEPNSIQRNINKLKDLIEDKLFLSKEDGLSVGITYHNPMNEKFNDTRTDCEAKIAGSDTENLEITEVIKPIIYYSFSQDGKQIKRIIQKGIVVVQSKNK